MAHEYHFQDGDDSLAHAGSLDYGNSDPRLNNMDAFSLSVWMRTRTGGFVLTTTDTLGGSIDVEIGGIYFRTTQKQFHFRTFNPFGIGGTGRMRGEIRFTQDNSPFLSDVVRIHTKDDFWPHDNKWHHLLIIWDGGSAAASVGGPGSIRFFCDLQEADYETAGQDPLGQDWNVTPGIAGPFSPTDDSSSSARFFNSGSNQNVFDGEVAELALWDVQINTASAQPALALAGGRVGANPVQGGAPNSNSKFLPGTSMAPLMLFRDNLVIYHTLQDRGSYQDGGGSKNINFEPLFGNRAPNVFPLGAGGGNRRPLMIGGPFAVV